MNFDYFQYSTSCVLPVASLPLAGDEESGDGGGSGRGGGSSVGGHGYLRVGRRGVVVHPETIGGNNPLLISAFAVSFSYVSIIFYVLAANFCLMATRFCPPKNALKKRTSQKLNQ